MRNSVFCVESHLASSIYGGGGRRKNLDNQVWRAINIGLRCIIVDTSGIAEGDEVEIDLGRNKVVNRTKSFELEFKEDELTKKILREGGIIAFIQKNGADSLDMLI